MPKKSKAALAVEKLAGKRLQALVYFAKNQHEFKSRAAGRFWTGGVFSAGHARAAADCGCIKIHGKRAKGMGMQLLVSLTGVGRKAVEIATAS